MYQLALGIRQTAWALTFTHSVNAQLPEPPLNHCNVLGTGPVTEEGRENEVKPGPCLKKEAPPKKGSEVAGTTGNPHA